MNRLIHYGLGGICAILLACLMVSCHNTKQKTPEQIKEDYHKYLITPDLALCELMGNVSTVEYPEGFLQQYVPDLPARADTVSFMPDGMSTFAISIGSDTLLSVRGTGGEVIGFEGGQSSGYKQESHYQDDRNVDHWTWRNAAGDSLVIRFQKEGRQVSSFTVEGHKRLAGGTIKDIQTDDIGNWISRTVIVRFADGTKHTQHQRRIITYY